ncbi:MAG TPA: YkgJ family cysteine cluster protein [Methanotrichaceae archaeon]|nr:YkgJ family cysteine cluster protein [Methanotrichaceae archaeon]
MDKALRDEIGSMLETLCALRDLLPPSGSDQLERGKEEMNELISEKYEPYFCGNAALHLLSSCQRCGRCCRDENTVALSVEDCRKIAKHLGLSLKRFNIEYTRPHALKGEDVGNARMIRKAEKEHCPFYDASLPGCAVHSVKPQVCSAALYLSKMNLLLCKENGRFSTFKECPSDRELRARIKEFGAKIRNDPGAMSDLVRTFQSDLPEIQLFRILLRQKGMEIYFGREKAARLARKLGLKRMPSDEELKPIALLYAVTLLEAEKEG